MRRGNRPNPVVTNIGEDFTFSSLCSCVMALTWFGFVTERRFSLTKEAGG